MHSIFSKGFTLIELMITVVILGILAAIAVPSYTGYVARAQVSDALSIMSGLTININEYYATHGSMPEAGFDTAAPTGLGLAATNVNGKYETVVLNTNGQMVATFVAETANALIASGSVSMQPGIDTNGGLLWQCNNTPATDHLCGGGACATAPVDATSGLIGSAYLPGSCQ